MAFRDVQQSMGIRLPVRRGADQREPGKWRPSRLFALRKCRIGKLTVAAFQKTAPERMAGKSRLDDDFAAAVFPAGPPRNLNDRLREPLAGTKIRAEQTLVGVDDADQRQFREMMTL